MTNLTDHEIERYSRQLILSTWSAEKQLKLKHARIAIDADYEAAAYYLLAAGAENLYLYGENIEKQRTTLQKHFSNAKINLLAEKPETDGSYLNFQNINGLESHISASSLNSEIDKYKTASLLALQILKSL